MTFGSASIYCDPYVQYPAYYHQIAPAPVECSGDVHVFPCPHCDKCKCGKARKEQP